MSNPGAIMRTEDLSKQFGSFTVLRSVSLSLASGESMTIFGRNGAGKTTLLKIIAGLTRSYRGRVYLFDKDLQKAGDALRGRIGFVAHETLLYRDLSVHDNLMFYGRLYGVADARSVVARSIARIGLETKASTPVHALSRGMKQRLSLGRAFLHNPHLLLLDEPFTGLDEQAVDILDGMLDQFRKNGGSIIMASHNVERGWKHADRIAILDRSSVVYETPTGDTTHEKFRARYREILSH